MVWRKRFFLIIEITLSASLAVFISARMLEKLSPRSSGTQPVSVSGNALFLEGRVNIPDEGFHNLISFDYTSFLAKIPAWKDAGFTNMMKSHSLFLTRHRLDEVTEKLLSLNIPYWQKGAVTVSLKHKGSWIPLEELVDTRQKQYALEDLFFLGTGMDAYTPGGITPLAFMERYFHGKGFSAGNLPIAPSERVIIKIENNER